MSDRWLSWISGASSGIGAFARILATGMLMWAVLSAVAVAVIASIN